MVKEYLHYIDTVRGLSPATVDGYRKDIGEWVKWASKRGLTWSTISERDVDAWLTEQAERGITGKTRNRRLAALRGLTTWAHYKGMLKTNPARFVQRCKTESKLPVSLNVASIDKYLNEPSIGVMRPTCQAAVALMLETGMRIGEVMALRWDNINEQEKSIKVKGKGGKERVVYYSRRCEKALAAVPTRDLLEVMPLVDQYTLRMAIEKELQPYVGKMKPHELRHTFATEMVNRGCSMETVKKLLGHARIETTQIYAEVKNETAKKATELYMF